MPPRRICGDPAKAPLQVVARIVSWPEEVGEEHACGRIWAACAKQESRLFASER